jgi:hypothetical protein
MLPHDPKRIQQTFAGTLSNARKFQSQNHPLAAVREYQSLVRNFRGLADISDLRSVETSLPELTKSKAMTAAEKEEASALDEQARMTASLSVQMQTIGAGDRDQVEVAELKGRIADLKKRADESRNSTDVKALVMRRALGQLVVEAYESGQRNLEEKNYRAAVAYFDLVAAGSANPAWAHYQRARAYAMLVDRKKMLAELKLSLAGGFHDPSALEAAEFQPFQGQEGFQALAAEWKKAAEKEKAKP